MGVIKRGILGGFSGKVGGVVGSSWKGISVMRSMPLTVANPKTVKQIQQRSKFSKLSKLASDLLTSTIKPYWDRFAQMKSGFNAFIEVNKNAFEGNGNFDFPNLKLSQGRLGDTPFSLVLENGGKELRLDYDPLQEGPFIDSNDLGNIVALTPDGKVFYASGPASKRIHPADYIIPIKPEDAGKTLHVYLMFTRPDGTIVSNSTYNTFKIP
jgi:hypothetical protein